MLKSLGNGTKGLLHRFWRILWGHTPTRKLYNKDQTGDRNLWISCKMMKNKYSFNHSFIKLLIHSINGGGSFYMSESVHQTWKNVQWEQRVAWEIVFEKIAFATIELHGCQVLKKLDILKFGHFHETKPCNYDSLTWGNKGRKLFLIL